MSYQYNFNNSNSNNAAPYSYSSSFQTNPLGPSTSYQSNALGTSPSYQFSSQQPQQQQQQSYNLPSFTQPTTTTTGGTSSNYQFNYDTPYSYMPNPLQGFNIQPTSYQPKVPTTNVSSNPPQVAQSPYVFNNNFSAGGQVSNIGSANNNAGVASKAGIIENQQQYPSQVDGHQAEQDDKMQVDEEEREKLSLEEKLGFEGLIYDPLVVYGETTLKNYVNIAQQDYFDVLRKSCEPLERGLYQRTLKSCEQAQNERKKEKNTSQFGQAQQNVVENYFKDSEFPCDISSLLGNDFSTKESWKAIQWHHPKEIDNFQDYKVIRQKVSPLNIRQGYINNVYFIAAIASLAEIPERIERLFPLYYNKERGRYDENVRANEYGIHVVNVCSRGEWRNVIVDEYIPCISSKRGPAFTRGIDGELWPILLEKAWAKLHDCYANIETGITSEVLHDFTGAPSKNFWLDDLDAESARELWGKLEEAEQNDYAMTCQSNHQPKRVREEQINDQVLKQKGIIPSHCYSLLGAYTFIHQGNKVQLVRLRNMTQSDLEWNGKWSHQSQEFKSLTPNQRVELDLEGDGKSQNSQGIFLMEFYEFSKYFETVQICYVHDGFEYSSIRATTSKKDGKFFSFRVEKEGKYYISVCQKSKRFYPKDLQKNFKYANMVILLARRTFDDQGNQKITYIEGRFDNEREVWTADAMNEVLVPGEYIVYIKANWIYNEIQDFVLSSYGTTKVQFTEITKYECPDLIKEAYRDHSIRFCKSERKYLKGDAKNENEAAWYVLHQTDDGFFYLVTENNTNENMYCEFKINKMEGLKLKRPYRGQFISFVLKPEGQRYEVVIFKVLDYAKIGALNIIKSINFKSKDQK